MNGVVKWLDGVCFVGESGSGHALVMDGAPEGGGRNMGPRPMELLLLGTAGCTAYDVVGILKKQRQDVRDVQVAIDADRADTEPRVFVAIRMHFTVTGRDLDPAAVERAVRLSADKYCSASIMLGKTAQMQHSIEILEAV